jgi:hypothetical protein
MKLTGRFDPREVVNCVRVSYGVPYPVQIPRAPETFWERVRTWIGHPPTFEVMMRPEAASADQPSIVAFGLREVVIEGEESLTEEDAWALADETLRALSPGGTE